MSCSTVLPLHPPVRWQQRRRQHEQSLAASCHSLSSLSLRSSSSSSSSGRIRSRGVGRISPRLCSRAILVPRSRSRSRSRSSFSSSSSSSGDHDGPESSPFPGSRSSSFSKIGFGSSSSNSAGGSKKKEKGTTDGKEIGRGVGRNGHEQGSGSFVDRGAISSSSEKENGLPSRLSEVVDAADKIVSLTGDDDLEPKPAKRTQNFEDFLPDLDELDKDELQEFLDLELESGLDTGMFRHYEIMFLIHEKRADEVQSVIEKVQDFIAGNKGVVHRLNNWGMRQLAYMIKKASKANYILMNIEISSLVINDLNTLFEKDERVIRHMVMSQKVGITEDSEPPEEFSSSRDDEADEEYEEEDEDEETDAEGEEENELVLQRE